MGSRFGVLVMVRLIVLYLFCICFNLRGVGGSKLQNFMRRNPSEMCALLYNKYYVILTNKLHSS